MIPFGHGLNVAVYVPYTQMSLATQVALIGYDWEGVDVSGDEFAYGRHFASRWAQRQPFVNVEHDCVPWPGAIEELMRCAEPWCAFDYSLPCHRERDLNHSTTTVPLGCTKVGAELIVASLEAWTEPVAWVDCDGHLTALARALNLSVHQHRPGIVNANPEFVGAFGFNASVDEHSTEQRSLSRAEVAS